MSHQKLACMLKSAKLLPHDKVWFGRWVDRYRRFCGVERRDAIPISRDRVITFLQQQKAAGKQAWQRLQIVKAIQFYQSSVLRSDEPPLDDIRDTLYEYVRQHPQRGESLGGVIDVAGRIDPKEPEPIQELRRQLRRLGREYSTE